MFVTADLAHLENTILNASSLSSRPMNTSSNGSCRLICRVKDQVSDLSIENIGSSVRGICRQVRVRVDEGNSREASSCFQDSHLSWVGIPNQICHIVLNNWCGN